MTPQDPLAYDRLHELLAQRLPEFFLAVFPEDALPRVEQFPSEQLLVARLTELADTEATVFPFLGYRFGISRPPRHLVTPWGALPLFVDQSQEIEEDGFLGRRQIVLAPPTSEELEDLDDVVDDAGEADDDNADDADDIFSFDNGDG